MNRATGPVPGCAGGDADVAAIAAVIGEPSRARLLTSLVGGDPRPATALAAEVGLSAPATSAHLSKLAAHGLVTFEAVGRHRYYRLAGPDVAQLVEALARLAPAQPVRSLRQSTRVEALRAGRTCYDHLAGRLGVALTRGLLAHDALAPADEHDDFRTARHSDQTPAGWMPTCPYELGPHASTVLAQLGVDLHDLLDPTCRRPLLRFCMDWSEQQPHLAGRLGAALSSALIDAGWVERRAQPRAVMLTERGTTQLEAVVDGIP